MGTPSIPTVYPMPKVQDQFSEDGTPQDPAHERRARRFIDELEWYARALKRERAAGLPY